MQLTQRQTVGVLCLVGVLLLLVVGVLVYRARSQAQAGAGVIARPQEDPLEMRFMQNTPLGQGGAPAGR